MSSLIIVSGYMAAIISNVSLYPQAWEVRRIIKTCEYEKLNSISLSTFSSKITQPFDVWRRSDQSQTVVFHLTFDNSYSTLAALHINLHIKLS